MKVIKFIFNIILKALFIFLLLLIFLLLFYFLNIKISEKRGTLSKISINMFVILTQSMEPTIKPGDIVIDYAPENNEYEVGDIITFNAIDGYHAGSTVTHRIIEIVNQSDGVYYRTKGDANNTADFSLVKVDNVIGKAVFKIPKAGYVRQFMVTKVGWIFFIIMPCLGVICYDLVKVFERIIKKDSKGIVSSEVKEEKKKENPIKFTFFAVNNNEKKDSDDDEENFWGID